MNNIHPLFRPALVPFAPASAVKVSPAMRHFVVSIYIGSEKPQELNVLAFTSCDAITRAIDIFFDGDEPMPSGGLEVVAHPINMLPSVA